MNQQTHKHYMGFRYAAPREQSLEINRELKIFLQDELHRLSCEGTIDGEVEVKRDKAHFGFVTLIITVADDDDLIRAKLGLDLKGLAEWLTRRKCFVMSKDLIWKQTPD
jgi:hypothetical protein